jgi:hypothetical protein
MQVPDYNLLLTGDFNRLDISYLLNSFDLENVVRSPTRGNATLDLVLLSSSLVDQCRVEVGPPVASSDHCSILCTPKTICADPHPRVCTVYDLRESHTSAFLCNLSQINFDPI